MSDIIERLRAYDPEKQYETPVEMEHLCQDAADEIDRNEKHYQTAMCEAHEANRRLRAINAELLEALEDLQLNCDGHGAAFREAYETALRVIAKAKGE